MFDDLDAMAKAFVGLFGAFISAAIGIITRHVNQPDGFKWARALIDLPTAAFSAIIAGGVGQWLQLPEMVILGLAGSLGYVGPHVVGEVIKKLINKVGDDD